MNSSWYTTDAHDAESWYAPGVQPPVNNAPRDLKRRRKTGVIVALGILGLLLLIALTSVLFGVKGAAEKAESDPGESVLPKDPQEYAKDFRKFFEDFYTPFDTGDPCEIPVVSSFPGRELPLSPRGDEILSLQEVYERCAPSVVAVTAFVKENSDDNYFWGTGVVMTEDGYIVTNSHVIQGSCRARITLWNDEEYDALLVGYDTRSDVAVLKIDAAGLIPARFCDGDDLAVGESVVAIGNPLGKQFRSTMTEGIVSGIDRDVPYNGTTLTLLQTSTPLNEGNSGGPLINRCGQVVGITNMKMSASSIGDVTIEGVGFAIPSRTVKSMADSLMRCGQVVGRPALGLTVGVIPDDVKEHYDLPGGLYVSAISKGSDAVNRGVQVGDILLTVNGQPLKDTAELTALIAEHSVGDELTFTVWHREEGGEASTFETNITLVDVNAVY